MGLTEGDGKRRRGRSCLSQTRLAEGRLCLQEEANELGRAKATGVDEGMGSVAGFRYVRSPPGYSHPSFLERGESSSRRTANTELSDNDRRTEYECG